MHQRYKDSGLVCMSVSLDEPKSEARSLAFLKKVNATFENYLLNEVDDVKEEKVGTPAAPGALVIGKDGRRLKLFTADDDFTYADIEAFVRPLLK
jgi:hypothetical protein